MELQKFAYCVKTGVGLQIETMRYSKRESIKAYMELKFPNSEIKWSNLSSGQRCVKVELKVLTQ